MPYLRLSVIYFVYFSVIGAMAPYWSLYLQSLSFSALEIGLVASVPLVVRILVPNFWGHLADRSGRRIELVRFGAGGALIAFSTLVFIEQLSYVVIAIAVYSFFWNAIMAQTEVITLHALGSKPTHYGKIRLWGSVGFIVSVLVLGYLFDFVSITYLPEIIVGLIFVLALSAFFIKQSSNPSIKQPRSFSDFLAQLQRPEVVLFFVATFLLHASHGAYYVFYSIYLEQAGYSKLETGVYWTVGVVAEIILFIVIHRIFARFELWHLLILSLFLTTLRWLGVALCVDHAELMLALQVLHAFSFGLTHAVGIEFCRQIFTHGMQSRGQALYSSLGFGAGSAFGALISGMLWAQGGNVTFLAAALMCALATVFSIYGARFASRV